MNVAMRDSSVSIVRMYCGARRRLDAHQLLGRVDERHLVGERREPVDAVDQRGDLRVRAELGELLVAAVHVADHRVGRDDALTVEAHDEPQRAVRRRVLRPEVEDHVAGVELDVHLRVGELAQRCGSTCDLGQLAGRRELGAGGHDVTSTAAVVVVVVAVARRASARRRRGPATASPRARATGSPCAAGGPRTPTAGRGGAGSGGRRTRCRTSPSVSRSCQSAPGYTETHDSHVRVVLVDVGLEGDAPVRAARRLRRCANTWKRPVAAGRRRRSSPSAARASRCRPNLRRRPRASGIQSMPATNER